MTERSDHLAPQAVDVQAPRTYAEWFSRWSRFTDEFRACADWIRHVHAHLGAGLAAMVAVPLPAAKSRTHASDRTRSKRWRAGSRRTKKLTRLARARGRATPRPD